MPIITFNQAKQLLNKITRKNKVAIINNASAGGHISAAAGTIQSKDLNQFKQNLKNFTQTAS